MVIVSYWWDGRNHQSQSRRSRLKPRSRLQGGSHMEAALAIQAVIILVLLQKYVLSK